MQDLRREQNWRINEGRNVQREEGILKNDCSVISPFPPIVSKLLWPS